MPVITIKGIPDQTLRALKIKAVRAEQSLQPYLLTVLEHESSVPTLADVMARLDETTTARLSTEDVLDAIDAGRVRALTSSDQTRETTAKACLW